MRIGFAGGGAAALAMLAGCHGPAAATIPASAAPISEAGAARVAAATEAAWTSTDAARIKALYAPGVVGFDMTAAPLSTDRATWDKFQDAYAAAKIDQSVEKARRIQILDADTFVVSGIWDVASSTIPANKMSIRCTDVYERTGAVWLIVNEHCSIAPTG